MILFLLAVPVGAFLWAKLEVEIEGKDGWAKALPTWRVEKHFLLDLFVGGRALTGYHLWSFTFVAFAYHLPLFWIGKWTWPAEGFIIGCVLLFWILEDFLWFILNPHFGWSRYNKEEIPWHPRWFLGFPQDHWMLLLTSIVLLVWTYPKL